MRRCSIVEFNLLKDWSETKTKEGHVPKQIGQRLGNEELMEIQVVGISGDGFHVHVSTSVTCPSRSPALNFAESSGIDFHRNLEQESL